MVSLKGTDIFLQVKKKKGGGGMGENASESHVHFHLSGASPVAVPKVRTLWKDNSPHLALSILRRPPSRPTQRT